MQNDNLICIIPIRSKSKSIKHKNIKMLAGLPLSIHAINAASDCKLFKKIIIATDSDIYKKRIQKYISDQKIVFFKRSKKSSFDYSPTEIVISEILKKNEKTRHICLVQATSPLINKKDLISGYKKYLSTDFDSLISGYLTKKFFWKQNKNGIKPLNYNPIRRPMRQKNKGTIVENGAFYFFKRKGFIKNTNRIFGKTGVHLMSEESSIEIDVQADFVKAEKILRKRK